MLVALMACFPPSVSASELGKQFKEYQEALESGEKGQILETAETVYKTAAKLPEDNKNFAAAALNYGKALVAVKEWDKAETYLKKSLSSHREIYGEEGAETIDPLIELARARSGNVGHSSRWRYRRYLSEALDIAESSEGEDSVLYAIVNLEAGKIALDSARDRQARRYLQRAHTAFSGPFEKNSFNHFLSAFYLGKYYLVRNRHGDAEPLFREALDLAEVEGSKASSLELITRAFLVEVYEEIEQPQKATAHCLAIGKARPFDMNREPEPIFNRNPEYPRMALQIGQEGYAVARFTISDTGFAEDIEIIETEGSAGFGRAAKKYLQQARYAPRYVDGEPVSTPEREMKVSFNLAD